MLNQNHSGVIQMVNKKEALDLLEEMEKGLKGEFLSLRNKNFNRNKKGYEYEKILTAFLESYLNGLCEFHVRVPLFDNELESLSLFPSDKNEFDVVATFNTAIPKIIFKAQGTSFIPYDAVAFVVETKKAVTKSALESDLDKFERLSKLKTGKTRFGITSIGGKYTIKRPLRILFYYEKDINETTMFNLLKKYEKSWDLVVILEENFLIGNQALPTIGSRMDVKTHMTFNRFPLLYLMFFTTTSIPCPPVVITWKLFTKLIAATYS